MNRAIRTNCNADSNLHDLHRKIENTELLSVLIGIVDVSGEEPPLVNLSLEGASEHAGFQRTNYLEKAPLILYSHEGIPEPLDEALGGRGGRVGRIEQKKTKERRRRRRRKKGNSGCTLQWRRCISGFHFVLGVLRRFHTYQYSGTHGAHIH